jgi:hypothetical protein
VIVGREKPRPHERKIEPPTPKAKGKGFLVIASKPWARVLVDGKDTGRNTPIPPSNPLALPAGNHEITLEVKSKRFNFTVTIRADETHRLIKTLTGAP